MVYNSLKSENKFKKGTYYLKGFIVLMNYFLCDRMQI